MIPQLPGPNGPEHAQQLLQQILPPEQMERLKQVAMAQQVDQLSRDIYARAAVGLMIDGGTFRVGIDDDEMFSQLAKECRAVARAYFADATQDAATPR